MSLTKTMQVLLITNCCVLFSLSFSATLKAQDSLEISSEYDNPEFIKAMKAVETAVKLRSMEQHDSAISILEDVLEISKEMNSKEMEARCLVNLGTIYNEFGDYDKSLDLYFKSYDLAKKYGTKRQIGLRAYNIGITYKKQGLFLKANEYLFKAIELFDEVEDKQLLAGCYNSIGAVQNRLENHADALEYHYKSLEIRKAINHEPGIAGSYNNLALVYYNMDSLAKSMKYYELALDLKRKLGNKKMISSSLLNLGNLYLKMGNLEKAESYYNEVASLKHESKDKDGHQNITSQLGKLYLLQGKYDLAENHLLKGLDLARDLGDLEAEYISLERLKNLYTKKKSYKQALEYFDTYITVKDSVYNLEKSKAITNLQIKYETDKKDEEIANLNMIQEMQSKLIESKSNTVTILYISASIFLVLLTIIFIAYKQKRRVNMEIRTLMKEKQHRTKNNLQTIASVLSLQSLESDNEEIKEAVKAGKNRVQSIVLIENMLNQNSASTTIAMDNYLEKLSNNLITAYDYKDKIQLDRSIDPVTLETEIATPVGLIVNELITNTFKYAFPGHTNPILSLKLTQDTNNNRITLIVADNGPGLPANSSNSMGLKLVRMLCKQLKAELHIQNESGLRYRIEIGM